MMKSGGYDLVTPVDGTAGCNGGQQPDHTAHTAVVANPVHAGSLGSIQPHDLEGCPTIASSRTTYSHDLPAGTTGIFDLSDWRQNMTDGRCVQVESPITFLGPRTSLPT